MAQVVRAAAVIGHVPHRVVLCNVLWVLGDELCDAPHVSLVILATIKRGGVLLTVSHSVGIVA